MQKRSSVKRAGNHFLRQLIVILLLLVARHAAATTYTVNSLDHPGTGSGTSGSLNWCITQANAAGGAHTINFSVTGTINVTSALPAFSASITLDGSSAPGFVGTPLIKLNGGGGSYSGLRLSAKDCKVYAIAVDDFGTTGISVTADVADNFEIGGSGKGCVVTNSGQYGILITGGDYGKIYETRVGTDWQGTLCQGNEYDGINLQSGASYNDIYKCWISCNGYAGIRITGSNSNYNKVRATIVGPISSTCSYNGYYGIEIESGASYNEIGSASAADMNKIAGNQYDGITVSGSGSLYNHIYANYFVCNAPPGGYEGVRLTSSGNSNKSAPVITSASAITVSGTSAANDEITVYRALVPSSAGCSGYSTKQGADYFGTTTATATGNWTLSGSFSGSVTAMATSTSGNSSPFATPVSTGVTASNVSTCTSVLLLPVELIDFSVQCQSGRAVLDWTTASEEMITSFIIQRSGNALMFDDIGEVRAAGDALTISAYRFTDEKPFSGFNYYRLKCMGANHEISFSKVVAAECSGTPSTVSVSPNPAYDVLIITCRDAAQLTLRNTSGQVVFEKLFAEEELPAKQSFDITSLPAGIYLLEVKDVQSRQIQKVVVQR